MTILFVSHSSEQIREFCHRAILLSGGGVVAEGAVEDVLTEYARLQLREEERGRRTVDAACRCGGADPRPTRTPQFAECRPARRPRRTRRSIFAAGRAARRSSFTTIGDSHEPARRDPALAHPPRPAPLRDRCALDRAAMVHGVTRALPLPRVPTIQSDGVMVEALLSRPGTSVIIDNDGIASCTSTRRTARC